MRKYKIIFKKITHYSLLAILVLFSFNGYSQTTIAAWNFPNNPDDAICDGGIAANLAKTISLINADDGNTLNFSRSGSTTNCASSLYWQNGSGVKCFIINDIVTSGYTSVTFSAVMKGNNNNSPRDFKIQYRYNNETWADVGSAITLTTSYASVATNLSLPSATNQADVDLRIIQTTNTPLDGTGNIGTGNAAWVEIDDIILTGTALSGLFVAPANLNFGYIASGGTSSSMTYYLYGSNLSPADGNITVTAPSNFEVSLDNSSFASSISVPYTGVALAPTPIYVRFTPSAANTDYNGSITNSGGGYTTQVVTVTGNSFLYCTSNGNTFWQTSITLVDFNTLSNISAKPAGYNDYTNMVTDVLRGSSYNLTVNLNTDGNYRIYSRVWIDWNHDGTFGSGEVYDLGSTVNSSDGATNLSPFTISVPTGATLGNTRMRVSAEYNAYPADPCGTDFDGEVEDYTLNVISPLTVFYSRGSNPALTSNWNSERDGTGTPPVNFTANNQFFVIQSTNSMTADSAWSVSGNNTKVQIESGASLTANAAVTLSANTTFQLDDGATYNHNTTNNGIWGGIELIGTNSIVNYGYAGAQNVAAQNYGNLSIDGGSTKTMQGNITVNGILDLKQGALAINGYTLTINGAVTRTGTATGTITGSATSSFSIAGAGAISDFYFTNATANLSSLIIDRVGANINLNSDLNLAGTLALTDGIISAVGKTISITNSAAVSVTVGVGSYIDGSVSRAMVNAGGSYVYPVGSSSCGSHWLTFSDIIGNSTIKTSYSCNGATTGDATIDTPMPININWHVEKLSGTFTNATVKLDGSEIEFTSTVAQSVLQSGTYSRVTSTPSIGSVTATNIGAIATDKWLAIGSSSIKTYYSYQPGSWNTPSFTWTLDPSGTTQVGSSIPNNDDFVVILSGRTVTLPSDIATSGLDITIRSGGVLDIAGNKFTAGLAALSGQGTLKIAGTYFPTVTTNNFINVGGGTTEFNGASFVLPSQATYNNLTINKTLASDIATQTIDLTLNGNLYVKKGKFQINDATNRRLKLTVNGDLTVDAGAFVAVGTGVTNSTITPTGITGAVSPAPFINYYDLHSHRIVLKGNFTNNGTVRFTNLTYPIYNAFPPIVAGATTGFATVYFQGASDNTLLCAGPTDFYNLVLDKGIDQTFKLTLYTSGSYRYFRLFGANTSTGDGGTANPNLKKALWIRTGTLVLEGTTVIPSLTEGTSSAGTPNSDFIIPANGALIVNGIDVIVQTTADDYREVNLAYGTTAANNASMGISTTGVGSSLSLYGKLQMNEGYLTTKESGGIITSSISPGQFILNKGTVDTKQFISLTGAASFEQNGGSFLLRGRFQRTPTAYVTVNDLKAPLNTIRANDASLNSTIGTFNINNPNNVFIMTGGTMSIYDVCGATAAPYYAFQLNSLPENVNVIGGTIEFIPTTRTGGSVDATIHLISTTTPLGNVTINRASSSTSIQLNTNPLTVLQNLNIASGVFTANNLNVTVGGHLTVGTTATYHSGTNTTTLNGNSNQNFTIDGTINNGAAGLRNFVINKSAGTLRLAGTQASLTVQGTLNLTKGTFDDNGKTVFVAGNIINSGTHISTLGIGKIQLNGTTPQTIGGDGNGIFNNLDINNTNAAAAPVSLIANTTISGVLNLVSNKIVNISTYNLNIASSGTISATAFSNSCYIHTNGQSGDGGITKNYSSNTPFVFPLGCFSTNRAAAYAYTPATIGFSSSPTSYGSITIVPVGYEHPATTINNQSLRFYWRVKSSGFTGFAGKVTHTFVYNQTDVTGTETSYLPSLYNRSLYTWNNGTVANPPINTTTNTITDWVTSANSTNFIDADYTAGNAAFGTVKVFYSLASGLWSANSTWTFNNTHFGAQAGSVPGVNDVVVIGNNHIVTLYNNAAYPLNTASVSCASLQIDAGSTLDIGNNSSSIFSTVVNSSLGNGTFRLTTTKASPGTNSDISTFIFPAGDFTDFEVNQGTEEFYTTTQDGNALYILPPKNAFGNMVLSPLGNASAGDNMVLPNVGAVIVYGDLTMNGATRYSAIGLSWNTNNSFYNNSNFYTTVEKTVNVKGDINVNGGSFTFFDDNVPQHLIVDENVNVAATNGANIIVWDRSYGYTPYNDGPTVANTLAIGGSLINNGVNNGNFDGVRLTVNNNRHYVDVTFQGNSNSSITGSGNIYFRKVTVNKGITQATTLTCNTNGTLSTPTDNWLTLQNGTFIYDMAGTNFNITTGSTFTIPATAGLNITNAGNVYIANAASNVNDVYLNGKLTVLNGNVYVGPSNGTTINNNDIEYSAGGASEIEIQGGNLFVNGQIRRNPSVAAGVLSYNQSGGTVTINGNNTNTTNAKLEVLNSGSTFNMSGGTLNIIKGGGGSAYGDLYLRPASGSVTGGNIVFAHNINATNQQYLLDATLALNNITITGKTSATAASATVKLMVNPLILNGSLTLTNIQSIFDANSVYSINTTIKGDFINNGIYNPYSNLTTFNGGTQSLSGTSATSFYNLNVSPATSLTLNRDITVLNDIILGSGLLNKGTFICGTNYVYVKNKVVNNATYTNANSTSGFVLNGTAQQHISGTGTFGQLELDNVNGSTIDNAIIMNEDLVLTNGIFDINKYLLTLGINSDLVEKGTPFGITKMITSDGAWSDVGIAKVFTSPLSTTFKYPIGTGGKYTPAVLTITSNGAVGLIRINNINRAHPAVIDPNNVLQYYWEVASSGISGFTGNLLFNYKQLDVKGGPESVYVAAQLLTPGTNWSKASAGSDRVDEGMNTILFNYSGTSNITGECTAGNDLAIPNIVPQYTSNANGNWSNKNIWTPSGGTSYPCPDGGPNGFIVTIDHEVTMDKDYVDAYKTYLNNKLMAVSPYYGHSLGTIYGNGTLYVESTVFPAGRFTSFLDCSGNGCLEYGGTGIYNVNADLYNSVPRLTFSGTGSRMLPDKNLTICKQLLINGPVLDNRDNNRQLFIQGTMLLTSGSFMSGTGSNATVSFTGSAAQTIQDFNGVNAFNNLEINNSAGLTLTGQIDVVGNLLLTNGIITTTMSNILKITNFSVNCVTPNGGSASSYVNGPLMKLINQGDPTFVYPIGKLSYGLGDKFALRATQTGSQYWTAEMFNPNDKTTFQPLLTAVNTKEYWTVSGVSNGSTAFVEIGWKPSSDLTPLMTVNGLADMRVAEHNGADWIEISSTATSGSGNSTGSTETTAKVPALATGTRNYTLSCINVVKPRIRLSPSGPVCGDAGIPVTLTTSQIISAPYTITYTENGTTKTINPASFPATIPTLLVGGTYILTGFTYTDGVVKNGVFDSDPVVANPIPTTATVGIDQSNCGVNSTTLTGNNPIVGTGFWTIISGTGGTVQFPTIYNSTFSGDNGADYTLRWTITSGTGAGACTSFADLDVSFPLLALQPSIIAGSTQVCDGEQDVVYSVTNDASVISYTWTYTDPSALITQTRNSVSIDFNNPVTDGTLTVYATNGCISPSPDRTLDITVNPIPTITLDDPILQVCQGGTSTSLVYTATTGSPDVYSIDFDATAESEGFVDVTDAPLVGSPISITVPAAASTGTFSANLSVIKSVPGCVSIDYPVTITVDAIPAPTITGTDTTCVGTTLVYTTEPGMNNYVWTVDGSFGNITLGAGTNTITVDWFNYNALGSPTTISVTYDNAGCIPISDGEMDVMVFKIPETGPQYHIKNEFGL